MSYCNSVYQIRPDLYCIKDVQSINKYLIIGDQSALLFDTGFGFEDFRPLLSELTDKRVIVVNSHGDVDHVYGNYLFNEVYISSYDYSKLLHMDSPEYKRKELEYRMNKPGSRLQEEVCVEDWMNHSVFEAKYHFIDEGYVFHLGGRDLEVIALPGHTAGSVALFDQKNGMLFTGDSVMKYNIYYCNMPKISRYCEPIPVYYHSLKKLLSYDKDIKEIFPGHGEFQIPFSIVGEHLENIREIYEDNSGDRKITSYNGDELYEHRFQDTVIYYSKEVYDEMMIQFPDFSG